MRVFSAERSPVLKVRDKALRIGQRIVRQLDGWGAYWNGLWLFVLGHDRIHNQHAGWQQEYTAYFGIYPKRSA